MLIFSKILRYRQYTYIVSKNKIYLYEHIWPVLLLVQINFIFTCNMYIVFILRCHKLSENSWNKCRSNRFQWCPLWSRCLYWYHFLLLLYMNLVPEKLYLGQWPYSKNLSSQCKLTSQQNQCRMNVFIVGDCKWFWFSSVLQLFFYRVLLN